MKTNIFTPYAIALLSLFVFSCTKEAPMGPQGPQGEQGNPGEKGNPGPPGDNGQSGGEVITSNWTKYTFTGSGRAWKADITDSHITQDVLNKADITVYIRIGGQVQELNYFEAKLTGFHSVTQALALEKIQLSSTFDASDAEFRYKIVPAGVQSNN